LHVPSHLKAGQQLDVTLGPIHVGDHSRATCPALRREALPLTDERLPSPLFVRYAGLVAAAARIGRNVATAAFVEI